MTKKGHKIASWKERWFVLTTSTLTYYESLTNRTLKVCKDCNLVFYEAMYLQLYTGKQAGCLVYFCCYTVNTIFAVPRVPKFFVCEKYIHETKTFDTLF